MSLEKFISHVKQIGFNTASKFEVLIPNGSETISILCQTTSLPGYNIMTNELRYFGENIERPHGISYTPITLSFYLDNDLTAKKFFDTWADMVFNRTSRTLGFYDSYTKNVEINLLDKNDNVIETVRLIEAYPKIINEIQLDTSSNAVSAFSVTLVYKWWESASDTTETVLLSNRNGSESGRVSEGLGNTTFNTLSGNGFLLNPTTLSMGDSLYGGLVNTGDFILSDSTRTFSQAQSLFGASTLTSGTFNNVTSAFSQNTESMGSGFSGLGSSFSQMADSLSNIAAPIMSMSTSIGSVAGAVGSFGGLVTAVGGNGSKFSNLANKLAQSAGSLQTVSQLNGIPGHLQSVSANLGSVGASVSEAIAEIKSNNNSFDAPAEQAFTKISAVFNGSSASLGSVASLISSL